MVVPLKSVHHRDQPGKGNGSCKGPVMRGSVVHVRNGSTRTRQRYERAKARPCRAFLKILRIMASHGKESGDITQCAFPINAAPELLGEFRVEG